MREFKRLNRELKCKGAIINFYTDTIETPTGKLVKWDYIGHNGAAAVVPVSKDGNIIMVKQFRNALDRYTLEIPAGALNNVNEPSITCAARELEEETGYRSTDLEYLITVNTAVAFCNEVIDIYVATNLIKTEQNLDEDEFVEIEEHSIESLVDKIYNAEIKDSKTTSALLAYYNKYCRDK